MRATPEDTLFRPISAGLVIKKINEINPGLRVQEIREIISLSSGKSEDSSGVGAIDINKAIELARKTLPK